jgi:Membrane protein involved in the export of O-antigen and teichoic acid
MNKKILKNYIYNLIQQILLVISPLITIPFLSRSLGADGVGAYSYAFALTNYFTLVATLGCDVYGRREISYVKNSLENRSKKFWSIQIIKTVCTLLVGIVYIIFSLNNTNKVLLLILTFHLVNVPLNIGWFYQGTEKFKKITIRTIFLKLAELLFVVFCIHSKGDLIKYTFGSSFINFLTFFVLWLDIKNDIRFEKVTLKEIKFDLKNCLQFFLPAIATSVYTLLDKTMLGILTGSYTENGYYEQAQKINIVLLRIVLSLGLVLLPQIASAFKEGNKKQVNEFINKSGKYVFFISLPLALGLICISDNFVPWFFGNGYNKVSELLKLSGFILIMQGLDDVFGMQYLVNVGKQKQYIISLFSGAIMNFIFNLILIPKLASAGAIIASFLGELVIVLIQMYYVKDSINLKRFFKQSKNYVIASLAMLIIIPLNNYLKVPILNTVIIIGLSMVFYFTTLFILKDDTMINVLKKIKDKIKSKNIKINN